MPDLLAQGDDREPLLSPRSRRRVLAGVVAAGLVALGVLGVAALAQHRAAERSADVVRLVAEVRPPQLLSSERGLVQTGLVLRGGVGAARDTQRPSALKCIQSLLLRHVPPQVQPIAAKARTASPPGRTIPGRTSPRST